MYWKLLSELYEENTNKTDPSTTISPGQWYDYLYDLKQDKMNSPIEIEIKQKLKTLQNTKIFNELDYHITENEVQKAIANLKITKLPALTKYVMKCSKSIVTLMCMQSLELT